MTLRSALTVLLALAALPAAADTAKLPSGFVTRVNPSTGNVEMQDGTAVNGGWVPIGSINPTTHAFVPAGQPGVAASAAAAQATANGAVPSSGGTMTGALNGIFVNLSGAGQPVTPTTNSDWATYALHAATMTATRGNAAKEWVRTCGLTTAQGAGATSDHGDKLCDFRGVQALPGAGNTWVDNDVLDFNLVDPTPIMIGYELDYNNASQQRYAVPTSALGPSFGALYTSTAFFQAGAALAIEGGLSNNPNVPGATMAGTPAWDAGLVHLSGANRVILDAGNSGSTVQVAGGAHNFGLDFRSTAFSQAGIALRGGGVGPGAWGVTPGTSPYGGGMIQWVAPTDGKTQAAALGTDGGGNLHLFASQLVADATLIASSTAIQLGSPSNPFGVIYGANETVTGNLSVGSAGGTTAIANSLKVTGKLGQTLLPDSNAVQLGSPSSPFGVIYGENGNISGNMDIGSAGGNTTIRNTLTVNRPISVVQDTQSWVGRQGQMLATIDNQDNAVNFIRQRPSTSGNPATLAFDGSDGSVAGTLQTKGGSLYGTTNGDNQGGNLFSFNAAQGGPGVNYPAFTAASHGNGVTITAASSDGETPNMAIGTGAGGYTFLLNVPSCSAGGLPSGALCLNGNVYQKAP